MEQVGIAEFDAVVSGALVFDFVPLGLVVGGGPALGLVFVALVLEERGEDVLGYGTVGFGAGEVAGEGADFGAGDVGGGDGGFVRAGAREGVDERDSLIGEEAGFGELGRLFAGGDEEQDDVVVGGGAGFELGTRSEVLAHGEGLSAGVHGLWIVVGGELLATGVQGLESGVELHVVVGRGFVKREVDGRGDDGGGGDVVFEERPVGDAGVCLDGGLAELLRAVEGFDCRDFAGGVDVDFEVTVPVMRAALASAG